MEERKHIVILAAGDFPTHEVPLRALHEADFVVCCDSAYREIKNEELRIENYVVIGDGDSLSEADKAALGDRWIQIDEQDYNDLHKAMAFVVSQFPMVKVTILGATGKREDHTLGNISYLVTFAEEYPDIEIEMLTDHGRFVAMTGRRVFASFPRQQISVFSMTPDLPFRAKGLRWSLEDFCACRWWQASLNEALGDSFTLCTEGWLVVFQTYEAKIPSA